MQMDMMWQEYGMDELEKGMQQLFPDFRISAAQLLGQLLQGDVLGAAGTLVQEVMRGMGTYVSGIKNILIWLIVLGILSALLIHFVEVFDKHQIADLSFYFIYLLMGVILLQCFFDVLQTARDIMENIILFVKLMVPTYLLAVGVASGPTTVGAGYQLMLLLIYGTEKILLGVVLPLIYSYSLLNLINGIWVEDDDDKIRLNQRKPSKYKGLRRFGPEKNLQRINKFMKERPIFYKNLIQMKENIRFYLRCFYCITKVMILQFNSENRTELARNG